MTSELEVLKFPMSKAVLDRAPADERLLYLQLGLIANEINFLHRDLIVAFRSTQDSDAEREAAAAQTLLTLRMLAGRLHVAHEMLSANKALQAACKDTNFRSDWKSIGAYFSKDNVIKAIRNQVAFHNSAELAERAYERLGDLEFNEYFTGHVGACLFGSAQAILVTSIRELVGEDDYYVALDRVMEDVLTIASTFNALAHKYLMMFWSAHVDQGEGVAGERVMIPSPQSVAEIKVPFFCRPMDPDA